MKRRDFLMAMAASAAGTALPASSVAAATGVAAGKSIAEIQRDWQTLLAKDADVARSVEPITKTEVEWKKVLPEEASTCSVRKAPSAHSPVLSTTRSAPAFSHARDARCLCSVRR
jgi:hypothetical protein